MSSELISLKDAAEALEVHYMTAYRYVRTGRLAALKRGGQWWIERSDLDAMQAAEPGAAGGAGPKRGVPREKLVEPLIGRLIAGDLTGSWTIVNDALNFGATPSEVHERLITAAMREIGERWAAGELSIAAEHRATATVQRILGRMSPLFRHAGRRRGTVVIGMVAGDTHALPTLLLGDLLSDARFDVIDLGADVPVESFVEVAADVDRLIGVGVCVMLADLEDQALEEVRRLRAELPGVFLLVGGRGIAARSGDFAQVVDAIAAAGSEAVEHFENAAAPAHRESA